MKTLIVEDEFTSRKILSKYLAPFGEVHVAIDGHEATKAFKEAHDEKEKYDLVCLDIMMPGMDGQAVLKEIRALEASKGIGGLQGVKIIMTTALGDKKNIFEAFRQGCEAYIVKPIEKMKFIDQLKSLGLVAK